MASGLPDLPLSRAANNLAPKSRNFVKHIVFDDCHEVWYLYVATFVPAFVKLFLTVAFFDLADLIRWRAAEEAGAPNSKSRRRRGRHMIRRTAREVPSQRRTYGQAGLRFLYIITAPIEKLGLIWLLYSAGDQFFSDWQTLLEAFGECSKPNKVTTHRFGQNVGASLRPSGQGFPMDTLIANMGGGTSNAFAATVPPGAYHVALGVTVRVGLFDLDGVGCQVFVPGPFGGRVVKSGTVNLKVGEPADLVVAADFVTLSESEIGGLFWEVYGPVSATGVAIDKADILITRR